MYGEVHGILEKWTWPVSRYCSVICLEWLEIQRRS